MSELTGGAPREVRVFRTDAGLVVFLTLGFDPERSLAEAHERASEIEARIHRDLPDVAEAIVHTEP